MICICICINMYVYYAYIEQYPNMESYLYAVCQLPEL